MPGHLRRVVRRYADSIEERLDQGQGLWFLGDVGTGKTTLAMLVSKAALERGRSVAIYSVPRLINLIRQSYNEDAVMSDEDLIDRLVSVDLLHLDDLNAERTNEWVLEQLYAIINGRYEEERAVVVTSNVAEREELRKRIGPRTLSRLTEMCEEIPVFGADRRLDVRSA